MWKKRRMKKETKFIVWTIHWEKLFKYIIDFMPFAYCKSFFLSFLFYTLEKTHYQYTIRYTCLWLFNTPVLHIEIVFVHTSELDLCTVPTSKKTKSIATVNTGRHWFMDKKILILHTDLYLNECELYLCFLFECVTCVSKFCQISCPHCGSLNRWKVYGKSDTIKMTMTKNRMKRKKKRFSSIPLCFYVLFLWECFITLVGVWVTFFFQRNNKILYQ